MVDKFFPNFVDSPSIKSLLGDLNGALINTNNVLDYPRLQPSTFLNIGGIQIAASSNSTSLPAKLETFINSNPQGTILFTMGFIFDPSVVPHHRIKSLLEVFGSLEQNVIIKLDLSKLNQDSNLTIPSNVLALPFVPQVTSLN